MNVEEINIVIALNDDFTEIVGAFTDRETAVNLYKQLLEKGVKVSIHAIEMNSFKEFIQEFDL